MAMTNYPSSSKRPFPDVEVEVEGGNKRKRKLYQVFISHRGPETKHSLAHHMYDVLKLKGFEVFFDIGEMEAGGDISHQILEAISTSAVQIAIISPGFGESVWCLKELVMMMQKHTDGSSLVIPVFYEVEPADLRFYKDAVPFCKRFRNKHVGRQSHETMEEWKMALKDLPNLSGFRWDEHKGKLVELVVQRVCDYTRHAHLHIPKHVIGIEKKLVETMEDIMKPQGKVTVVSITGIGGIGKTTFAKALFNHMCSQFDRHCFVDDVKGLLEKSGIVYIQKLLLEGLLNLNIPIPNSGNGQNELNERLRNQKVLLVLDNIDKTVRPTDIFIEDFAILCPSSIVIITSRVTCNFKNDCRIITVEIPKLDFQKSERLFCSQAFGDDESKIQEEHHMLVRQIVQKCDGIPLALVLFGRHIFERDPSDWTAFWEMHRDSLPSDLSSCLQITYDSLDSLQKKLFLDVAIFFHGEEVRPVRNLWDDCASKFKYSLDVLKGKLLIEVTEQDRFRMHDILRDLGRTIVDNEDQQNPGGRSRLWREEDIVSVLSEGRGTDKVQALSLLSEGSVILDADEDGNPRPWKVEAFSTMPSLKMLFLHGNCIEGDLSKLPKGLEFLRWTVFPFDAVSIPLKVAKVVDFSDGRQKRLWDLQSMEAPKKLTELGLRSCGELEEIRWDKKFSQLKYLDLTDCPSLRTIADNFSILQRLECLTLSFCHYLESLPESFSLLTNLRKLNLSSCKHIKELPESFGQLTNLQELNLSYNKELKRLPESFGRLGGLRYLCMKGDTNLEMLPDSVGQLAGSLVLEIDRRSIEKIVHSGRLQGFHELKFEGAWPIRKLVLIEDNPERRLVLSRVLNNYFFNNHFPAISYWWVEDLPLYPITIMDVTVSGWLPCVKMLDELASKGAATHKFLFRCLKPSPSSSTTRVADGEHCKFKCIGAAICFDFDPHAFGQREVSNIEFSFGCTKWDPIYYTTGGGTSLFCMAVYDSPEEISLDKMSVCLADESLQGIGWVCYFLERDEDLFRRLRNSFPSTPQKFFCYSRRLLIDGRFTCFR